MLYNNRYWFSKYSGIKKEYDFASPIYCIDASIEHGLIFLGQEDKVSKYTVSTKTPATITANRCTRLAYNESGTAAYKSLRMILNVELESPPGDGVPREYEYLPATNTLYTTNKGQYRCVESKRGVNDSLWSGNLYINYDNYPYVRNITSISNVVMWYTYGPLTGIAAVSNSEAYLVGRGMYTPAGSKFRRASDTLTDLAAPGVDLDKLKINTDNTKIYGIAGNWWSSLAGTTTLYIYNVAGNSWSTVSLPAYFIGYSICFYNNSLFVIGYDTAKAKGCIAKFDGTSSFELFYTAYNEKLYTGVDYNGVLYLGGSTGKLSTYTE